MLAFMDRTELSSHHCCKGKNGAPHSVPRTTLGRWWDHFVRWGETPIQTSKRPFMRHGRDSLGNGIGTRILALVDADPSLYLDEIQQIIVSETGCRYHVSTIWRFLNSPEIGYTLQVLAEKAIQKSQYEQMIYRGALSHLSKDHDPSIFCFVDESAVGKNASRRRRGWSRRGRPAEKWALFEEGVGSNVARYTLIGAVDINGFIPQACDIIFHRTTKTNTSTGTVDADRFVAYVAELLVPQLGNYTRGEPRSVVVMDNATIHKDPRVQALIEATGAKLIWNAAYSPELNPIETCFHQYKSCLRRNIDHFKIDELGVHYFALRTSVTRTNMINYYGATAMRGCIHNLPPTQENPKKKRKVNDDDILNDHAVLLLCLDFI